MTSSPCAIVLTLQLTLSLIASCLTEGSWVGLSDLASGAGVSYYRDISLRQASSGKLEVVRLLEALNFTQLRSQNGGMGRPTARAHYVVRSDSLGRMHERVTFGQCGNPWVHVGISRV